MKLGAKVKEKIARTIAGYFTTNQIVSVFEDANISTDVSLYAKWRITLDAFSKIPKPEEGLLPVLEEFCHPQKWLELTEKTFNFARYARKEFILGDLNRKREMFSALGQNFWVKDKKIHIEPNEWFVPIEKAYPSLLSEYNRLELNKTLDNTSRNEQYAQIILTWCAVVERIRTTITH